MRVLTMAVLVMLMLAFVGCSLWTPERRAEVVNTVAEEVTGKVEEVFADLAPKMEAKLTTVINEKAIELNLSKKTAKRLAESVTGSIKETVTKLVEEKTPEVVRKTIDAALPPADKGGGAGGTIATLFGALLQAGMAFKG